MSDLIADPTRKDAGHGKNALVISISVDALSNLVKIETNIVDAAVFCRVIGQAMHIWADEQLRKRL